MEKYYIYYVLKSSFYITAIENMRKLGNCNEIEL